MALKETLLSDIQGPNYVSQAMRLGLERSAFEPLRFITTAHKLGIEAPDRLTQLPFGNVPVVKPSRRLAERMISGIGQTSGDPNYNWLGFLVSRIGGGADPTDVDPSTGLPRYHFPSLFKSMSAPTRFLPPSLVLPQMPIPFNASGTVFDTKRATLMKNRLAPSPYMVDLYHNTPL